MCAVIADLTPWAWPAVGLISAVLGGGLVGPVGTATGTLAAWLLLAWARFLARRAASPDGSREDE
jgi:hypothetical protein